MPALVNKKQQLHALFSRLGELEMLFVLFGNWTMSSYLNNRVFLWRNYRLIVAPRKFYVLKTNTLALRTSHFQGATIRAIVPRHKHSIVFIVHH